MHKQVFSPLWERISVYFLIGLVFSLPASSFGQTNSGAETVLDCQNDPGANAPSALRLRYNERQSAAGIPKRFSRQVTRFFGYLPHGLCFLGSLAGPNGQFLPFPENEIKRPVADIAGSVKIYALGGISIFLLPKSRPRTSEFCRFYRVVFFSFSFFTVGIHA